jgi:phytoene dehydrogenase-like protein
MPNSYDAIIIGGGHNGLTTAAYLAKAGKKVLVLERRHILGGAAVTEELYPGFKFSVCSYVVSLLRPEVIRELELAKHGLHLIPLDCSFMPMENGDYLAMWPDSASTRAEMARHSRHDADIYPEFANLMYNMGFAVKPILNTVPPDPLSPGLDGARALLDLVKHAGTLDSKSFYYLTKLMTMSASDFLDEWFEADIIKAGFSVSSIIGTMLGPKSPGTAYVLLHHYMGELDGAFTAWGFQKGGTGAVSEAIASAARSYGAETRCNAPVSQVIIKNDRAVGVVLDNGEEIYANRIISGCDPYLTFMKFIGDKNLPTDFAQSIRNFKFRGSSGKVNLALDGLPTFTALPSPNLLQGVIDISPSMNFLERAYDDAKYGDFSRRPLLDTIIPSIVDPSMAPPGKHVMSMFVQYAPYKLNGGWNDAQRDAFGDAVINTLAEFAPDIREHILYKQVLTPYDLEQQFGLTEGNIFHGELTLDQLFFLRPTPGWANYRTPIRHYYQCGSGTHPGGGITGGPGRLAALEILKDWK